MKTIFPFAFFLLFQCALLAQPQTYFKAFDPNPENVFWTKQGAQVFQHDSFYYVLVRILTGDQSKCCFVKLDTQGEIVQIQSFNVGLDDLSLVSGYFTHDGYFLFSGYRTSYDTGINHAVLIKMDMELNLNWMREFSNPVNDNSNLFGGSVIETDDQQSYLFYAGNNNDHLLFRTDLNGILVCTSSLADNLYPFSNVSFTKTLDGNLLIPGRLAVDTTAYQIIFNPVLRKVDVQGNMIWHKVLSIGNHALVSMLATPLQNGKFAVVCTNDSLPGEMGYYSSLFILNETGQSEHEVRFDMPKGVQFPINLTTTANGDIIGVDMPIHGILPGYSEQARTERSCGNVIYQIPCSAPGLLFI